MLHPWKDYDAKAGWTDNKWDAENWPFVVRWAVSYPDRLTRWISHGRNFKTLEEAVTAYKRPFCGLSVDMVKYNGKPSGQHLDRLASRKAKKSTKWADEVPVKLRT